MKYASISAGVFLALMGEQWRERAHARELARDSLQRFRVELVRNRKSIEAVKDYHRSLRDSIQRYLDADAQARDRQAVQVRGLHPATFERTAWDLALATRSLADIDPNLAFDLSRIYGLQTRYDELTRAILQAIYIRPIGENMEALFYYYGDAVLWDTALLEMYRTSFRKSIERSASDGIPLWPTSYDTGFVLTLAAWLLGARQLILARSERRVPMRRSKP